MNAQFGYTPYNARWTFHENDHLLFVRVRNAHACMSVNKNAKYLLLCPHLIFLYLEAHLYYV